MSWADLHQQSERLAAEAKASAKLSVRRAQELYGEAAKLESAALEGLAPTKLRTLGVTAVSAAALWFKAKELVQAQKIAYKALTNELLPAFAVTQLQELLQSIWSEQVRKNTGLEFSEEAVLFSIAGGQSVTGGAPLDLILSKVDNIKSIFFRTVEYLQQLPHRKKGAAPLAVQNICRPWLFQTPPGSYQFAVAIERTAQKNLYGPDVPGIEEINETFLSFLRASADDPGEGLAEHIPDKEYRGTFLKLTRALAPTGKDFSTLTIRRGSVDSHPITLNKEARKEIGTIIREQFTKPRVSGETSGELKGILRALHLDDDWLEVTVGGTPVKVYEVGEAVDDVVGPLVNHQVLVQVVTTAKGRMLFRDIEAAF